MHSISCEHQSRSTLLYFLHMVLELVDFFKNWSMGDQNQQVRLFNHSMHALVEDSFSHFFLHHGDNLRISLVSQTLSRETHTWSQPMVYGSKCRKHIRVVEGTTKRPNKEDPKYTQWIHCNNMLLYGFKKNFPRPLHRL